ncbi:MAG: DUF502 domain-containing protein [Fulvivirga sp.]
MIERPEDLEQKQYSTKRYVIDTVIKGVLVLLPLLIIGFILSILFDFIFEILTPLSHLLQPGQQDPHWSFTLLSLFILAFLLFLIGLVIRNRSGRIYFKKFERKYLFSIPLYNMLHQTVNHFTGVKDLPFNQAVLIDPFNSGTLMTGFVTDNINEDMYCVFVPTAPNPTNGNIFHVKKEAITFLDVTPQDAMRTVIGMGTGTANLFKSKKPLNKEVLPRE